MTTYRDGLYASYVSGHQGQIAEGASEANLMQDIVSRLPNDRGLRILDVGCGQGQLVRLIRQLGYANVFGIDVSSEQIALARELGTLQVEEGDLHTLASSSAQTWDVVIAVDVVEHFDRPDVQSVFQAFSDLLKPGGIFILRTPNGCSPYAGRILFSDLTHGVIYTRRSLEQIGNATGFSEFLAYEAPPAGTSLKAKIRRGLWWFVALAFRAPLVIETGELRGHLVTQNLIGVGRKK